MYKRGRDWALSENKARLASQHFYVNAYDPDRYGDYVHCTSRAESSLFFMLNKYQNIWSLEKKYLDSSICKLCTFIVKTKIYLSDVEL